MILLARSSHYRNLQDRCDIAAKRVDYVAVYKVDRHSRSLMDFARIMGVRGGKCQGTAVTRRENAPTIVRRASWAGRRAGL